MWFKNHVKSWISVAITRCKARIQKSIELNETVTDKIKISTSAIDTIGFIEQVAKFWSDLDWPDASISYSMMVYMVQEMSDLAQFYVQQLYQARIDSYKSLSQFAASDDVSRCVCVGVSLVVDDTEWRLKDTIFSSFIWADQMLKKLLSVW